MSTFHILRALETYNTFIVLYEKYDIVYVTSSVIKNFDA